MAKYNKTSNGGNAKKAAKSLGGQVGRIKAFDPVFNHDMKF